MIDDFDFQSSVEHFMNDRDSYSKEELYDAYLEMTERYLNEMINTLNFESILIQQLGEEKGNEIIEKISTSNPFINELDNVNALEVDRKEVIRNLMAYIACEFGFGIAPKPDNGLDSGEIDP